MTAAGSTTVTLLVVSGAILAYLMVALIFPERF